MAEQEQVLIEVKFDTSAVDAAKTKLAASLTAVNQLKQAQKDLTKEIQTQGYATKEQAEQLARINKQLEEEKRSIKSNTAIIQASTQARLDENASLDEQRQVLGILQKAFAGLTKEQKEAMGGEEALAGYIKNLNDSLVELEHSIGENGRNVGNYTESILKSFGEMAHAGELLSPAISLLRGMGGEGAKLAKALDSLSKVMQLLGKSSKIFTTAQRAQTTATEGATVAQEGLNAAMAANPIGLVIAAVSTLLPLVQSIADAFGDATEETEAFNNELERQNRIIDQLQQDAAFEAKIAGIFGATAQEQLRIQLDAAIQARDIADKKVDDLLRIQREGSKKEKKAAKEAYAQALEQQKAAQEAVNRLNRQMTEQNLLDHKKVEDEKTANAKKAQEQRQADADEAAEKERAAAIQHMEDMRLLAEANLATIAAQEEDLRKQYQDILANLNEDEEEDETEPPTPEEQAMNMWGLDQEGVDYFKSLLEQGVEFSEAKTQAIADQTKRMTKSFASSFGKLGESFGSLANMLGEFTDESAEAANAQKAFALMSILLSQAQSIAEGALAVATGIEKATEIGFPQNIPAIIATVATIGGLMAGVASTIMQAKQLFSQAGDAGKFAEGGIVGGTSYTGDRLTAHVNSREMILPMEAQKTLFDALSSSNNGDNLQLGIDYGMIAQAVSAQPAPVLVIKELADAEDKVTTIQEIASV